MLKEREKMLGTILARMGPEDSTATEVCSLTAVAVLESYVLTMCCRGRRSKK